ncbi:hypothetical protein KQ939_00135 [Planococcus sp. CP5-4]|uniref:lipopolysaccharide biosynthesis protein n=1 Tax=unclassified Planococcus (in: firmicutes) TaxID=2662419 RepID=UPI001C23059A|nr:MULTISPECIES: hypothetical protein [unclassified Planococcus (in: firmicutes)]MBU9675171.1 hypothetical protein [Planococcus sp. CP5-4_YE]MBV0908048.1 hypothetical protein [Planococcus sp. CP5-4_UN]MBW6062109.1 hypothetical protein [Planococcus sp. CP5-4]
MKIKNNFFSDITLNIIAAGLVAVISQFVVYPLLGKELSTEYFGELLIMMSVVNIVAILLGNSLNNIRLIYNSEYINEKVSGDFSVLLLLALVLNVVLVSAITFGLWPDKPLMNNLILVVVSVFTMLRSYLGVEYRLNLNYKKILMHSVVYSTALSLGTLILFLTEIWPLIFLVGELTSFIYLYFTTNLLKERFSTTYKFKRTLKQYSLLSLSSLIGNVLLYLDRIIIFPFLGAHSVAVFFAATVIGKMSSFIISPISGVILSYLSNKTTKMSLKKFNLINLLMLFLSFLIAISTSFISSPLLKILYPNVYLETLEILLLANLAVILQISSSIPQTILLKYSSSSFQVVIQVIYGITYITGGIFLIGEAGLKGFCIAAILAALIKYLTLIVIGTRTLNRK